MKICSYGCGKESKFLVTKMLKPCCTSHHNKCPGLRLKNSKGLKRAIKLGIKKYDYYDRLSDETKRRMAWSRGLTEHTDERVKKYVESRRKSFALGKFKIKPVGVSANDSLRWKRTQYKTKDSFGEEAILESKNEILFANLCNKLGIRWKRSKRFELKSGKSYTPDFFLPDLNIYTDPKSYFWQKNYNKNQSKKIDECSREYKIRIIIFWDKEIKDWEKKLLLLKG
jgi:hypothetical protein